MVSTLVDSVSRAREISNLSAGIRVEPSPAEKIDQDWKLVISGLRQFEQMIGRHPKLLQYVISRDEMEISVKIKDSSERGVSYFVLSRRHPTDWTVPMDRVWLYDLVSKEVPYSDPVEAMKELATRIIACLG
jgi:hypothetical protein